MAHGAGFWFDPLPPPRRLPRLEASGAGAALPAALREAAARLQRDAQRSGRICFSSIFFLMFFNFYFFFFFAFGKEKRRRGEGGGGGSPGFCRAFLRVFPGCPGFCLGFPSCSWFSLGFRRVFPSFTWFRMVPLVSRWFPARCFLFLLVSQDFQCLTSRKSFMKLMNPCGRRSISLFNRAQTDGLGRPILGWIGFGRLRVGSGGSELSGILSILIGNKHGNPRCGGFSTQHPTLCAPLD